MRSRFSDALRLLAFHSMADPADGAGRSASCRAHSHAIAKLPVTPPLTSVPTCTQNSCSFSHVAARLLAQITLDRTTVPGARSPPTCDIPRARHLGPSSSKIAFDWVDTCVSVVAQGSVIREKDFEHRSPSHHERNVSISLFAIPSLTQRTIQRGWAKIRSLA